ncbi:Ion-translocating oxidoreductase complex subunit C [Gammaproteobacteria bacterium]
MPRYLFDFYGGIRVHGNKSVSTSLPVDAAPLPSRLILPLHQHIGLGTEPVVKVGDAVLKGQLIAKAKGYVSAPIHAPSSGRVVEIRALPVPHPSALESPCIVIETDGEDRWCAHAAIPDWEHADPDLLRTQVRDTGIVGLGGAGFPSSVKLNPGPDYPIQTLLLNGVECEPYITADDLLMRTRAVEIITGLRILARIVNPAECLIAVEDNKPEAYHALSEAAVGTCIEVIRVPTRYPMGGERQIIQVVTGKEVPSGGLPSHIGVVCHNVATAYASYRAVVHGEPLLARFITLTGGAVPQPRNLEVLLGTPVAFLLDHYQVRQDRIERLIMGGPMMGFALTHDNVPVVKTSNCLLCATAAEIPPVRIPQPCIRCAACATVCPANLLPQQLYWHARARDFDKLVDYHLFDCIECGCCAEVCPSHIPLVQYYRFAKSEISERRRAQQKADLARHRYEAREARVEREKQEKVAKLAQMKIAAAAPASAKEDQGGMDAKRAAIEAAIARAAAKKAMAGVAPKNTDQLSPAQQARVAEANARRTAARQAADQTAHPGDAE